MGFNPGPTTGPIGISVTEEHIFVVCGDGIVWVAKRGWNKGYPDITGSWQELRPAVPWREKDDGRT